MWSLYLGNLSSNVPHRELENEFRKFGRSKLEVKDGFGFVMYDEHADAARALKALQGRSICGEHPSIKWAKNHRPHQRLSDTRNYLLRRSRENIDSKPPSRKPSFDYNRLPEDEKRKNDLHIEGKNALTSGEDVDHDTPKEGQIDHASLFNGGPNHGDGLDVGRWDPHNGMSLEDAILDGVRQHEGEPLFERGSAIHHEGHNGYDGYKKGQHLPNGKPCYNCGRYGHIQRQCRRIGRNNHFQTRGAAVIDGRRHEPRYFHASAGRLRGMNGSRRIFTNKMEGEYVKGNFRNYESTGSMSLQLKSPEKSRHKHRHNRLESPKDSSNSERDRKKDKKPHHRSGKSKSKRVTSSDSSSRSDTSSSSLKSKSSSRPSSASQSHSSKSESGKPTSSSHTEPSHSRSPKSPSQSSISRSKPCSNSSDSKKPFTESEYPATQSHTPSLPNATKYDVDSVGVESQYFQSNGVDNQSFQSNGFDNQSFQSNGVDNQSSKSTGFENQSLKSNDVNNQSFKSNDVDSIECSYEGLDEDKKYAKRKASNVQCLRETKRLCEMGKTATHCEIPPPGTLSDKNIHLATEIEDQEDTNLLTLMKELPTVGECIDDKKFGHVYGAARLWSWKSILYRRLQRGLISVSNYERRRKQNEEFGIEDTFIRSSSGWYEKPCD